MNVPLIGMTPGEVHNGDHPGAPIVHGQSATYFNALQLAGGDAFVLPLYNDAAAIDRWFAKLDGLLLSGGNDIHPNLYDEEPYIKLEEPRFIRDLVEQQYLKRALEAGMPVLGICRGQQFVNVYFGGTLYQDIPTDLPKALRHKAADDGSDMDAIHHPITIEPDSKLAKILGETEIYTNTFHHQAVKDLGKGLKVTARSPEDGIIEGIESDDDRFLVCVQSHPEALVTNEKVLEWRKLFEAFVEQAGLFSRKKTVRLETVETPEVALAA